MREELLKFFNEKKRSNSLRYLGLLIRERKRFISLNIVPKSGTLKGCIHVGTLQIEPFRSKKRNDQKSDTKSGAICNRSVPFPSELTNGNHTNGTIEFPSEHKTNLYAILPFPDEELHCPFQKLERRWKERLRSLQCPCTFL